MGSQDPSSIQEKTRPGSFHEIESVESPVEAGVLRDDPSQVADEDQVVEEVDVTRQDGQSGEEQIDRSQREKRSGEGNDM